MARREFLSAAIVLLIVALAPARAQSLDVRRPAQIILIRHAEKPADIANPHLSPAGAVQRGIERPFLDLQRLVRGALDPLESGEPVHRDP